MGASRDLIGLHREARDTWVTWQGREHVLRERGRGGKKPDTTCIHMHCMQHELADFFGNVKKYQLQRLREAKMNAYTRFPDSYRPSEPHFSLFKVLAGTLNGRGILTRKAWSD